jgi:hypothetical protein
VQEPFPQFLQSLVRLLSDTRPQGIIVTSQFWRCVRPLRTWRHIAEPIPPLPGLDDVRSADAKAVRDLTTARLVRSQHTIT